jgi:DNA-binding beta-propeller fold protein YncE
LSLASLSCSEKFPLEQLAEARSTFIIGDTSYVEIVPPFGGFNEPMGLLIGNDQLMYVCDTKNDRVVQENLAGQIMGTVKIVRPYAITQDMRLDLLVTGLCVEPSGDSVATIFRIHLVQAQHYIGTAPIDTVWKETARPRRRFVGIAALPDNQFLVVRQGPDLSSFVDPDSRLLRFGADSKFITPVGDLVTRAGSGITDINQPTGIGRFPNSKDFIILQSSQGVAYGAIQMVYQSNAEFEGWLPKYDPSRQDQRFIDFVRPNRYILPEGVVVDGKRGDIFIADAAQDSVFKFDNKGRFRHESFGLSQTSGRMLRPSSLAFFDRTLYVLDSQTNRILRFRLSTDF